MGCLSSAHQPDHGSSATHRFGIGAHKNRSRDLGPSFSVHHRRFSSNWIFLLVDVVDNTLQNKQAVFVGSFITGFCYTPGNLLDFTDDSAVTEENPGDSRRGAPDCFSLGSPRCILPTIHWFLLPFFALLVQGLSLPASSLPASITHARPRSLRSGSWKGWPPSPPALTQQQSLWPQEPQALRGTV